MEREVGGGIGMGNTCKPMAVSFQCMTKFTTNKKKIIKKNCSGDADGTTTLLLKVCLVAQLCPTLATYGM